MVEDDQLSRVYRDKVLDHSRHPRNLRKLAAASHRATGHNPLCGDKVSVYLQLDTRGRISDASFEATGCAISVASASMLTDLVRGKDASEADRLVAKMEAMLAGAHPDPELGDLSAMIGVRAYPSRIRCATLPWRTLQAAFADSASTISTEDES